ncbi:MAG: response regulator transcription factor [Rhodospirillaceae bacterium]
MIQLSFDRTMTTIPCRRQDEDSVEMRLFIADDHPLILQSVKTTLEFYDTATEVTGFAKIIELEAALDNLALPAPDLVLIDFNMPGLASVTAVAAFVERHPDVKIGIISGQIDGPLARELIRHGCHGFIPKTLSSKAIYHAIRLMVSGSRFVPDFLAESAGLAPPPAVVTVASSAVTPTDNPDNRFGLTPREMDVLRSLATGITNKQIAFNLNIEESTVKLHLRRSFTKLGVRNRVGAAQMVLKGALD